MERTSSPRNGDEEGLLSCWGRLKLKFPWTRRRVSGNTITARRQRSVGCNITAALMRTNRQQKPAGGFRYDPLSYAQNFDEGCWDDDNDDGSYRGFSSRFAASASSKSLEDK